MFTDPIVIKPTATAGDDITCPRISTGAMRAVYRNNAGSHTVTISHMTTKAGRERSTVRIDLAANAADPYNAALVRSYTGAVSITWDNPANGVGITDADMAKAITALTKFVQDATNQNKLLGKES